MSDIFPIPALKDNYIWAWIDEDRKCLWVVDPGDATPVIQELARRKCALGGILLTHHHHDHVGGVKDLMKWGDKVEVIASKISSVPFVTQYVNENDEIFCGYRFKVMEIPGHTLDHVAFYNDKVLFSGDTLFSAGCGRIFEGTPEQMYQSLLKLMTLPDDVLLFCGHEYTLANLKFAQKVEPNNSKVLRAYEEIEGLRARGGPSLPSTLYKERQFNPFLRCEQADVIKSAEDYAGHSLQNPLEVFTILRKWKNTL